MGITKQKIKKLEEKLHERYVANTSTIFYKDGTKKICDNSGVIILPTSEQEKIDWIDGNTPCVFFDDVFMEKLFNGNSETGHNGTS